ncbi:hypothetical protein TNCV_1992391 [Trichonephila clavipes]|nr:hypothetical protein TNCV_1992391 [Trichonephila clavipes]
MHFQFYHQIGIDDRESDATVLEIFKSRCGRPHKLSDRDARAIVRKMKKNPKISAPKLADQIATASEKKVHPETVRRIPRSGGYNG